MASSIRSYPPPPNIELGIAEPRLPLARPSAPASARLLSLDVFRGLVIGCMLIVNNLGDGATTGYFWKHADWPVMRPRQAWIAWWGYASGSPAWKQRAVNLPNERTRIEADVAAKRIELRLAKENPADPWQAGKIAFEIDQLEDQLRAVDEEARMAAAPWRYIPIFWQCTLADYVMPCFMLIIGVAIPFSAAASRARGTNVAVSGLRVLRRAVLLVVLGWILVYFRDQFAASFYDKQPWTFTLGMDVLQLLGIGYLVTRLFYFLPPGGRALVAAGLLAWHWYLLRFWPQGPIVPAGTFMRTHEAIGDIYANSDRWKLLTQQIGDRITIGWDGLLSVPPTAAVMLLGTLMGDVLISRRRTLEPKFRVASLASWGLFLLLAGFLWSFDIPFNKPRWSPSYIVYVAGMGGIIIAILYAILDIHAVRAWAHPFAVFGANAITVYFLSILTKILLLYTPRVSDENYLAHTLFKWGTVSVVTLVLGVVVLQFARWAARQIGGSAYFLLLLALVPASIFWARFLARPIQSTTAPVIQHPIDIVLALLKGAMGPWVGGWLFTITFVAFWWLVLDVMYRRRIFWKL